MVGLNPEKDDAVAESIEFFQSRAPTGRPTQREQAAIHRSTGLRSAGTVAVALAFALAAGGCYHYRLAPTGSAPADDGHRAVSYSLAWGLVQAGTTTPDCQGNGVAEVTAITNVGFILLGLLTLGIYVPTTLEWKCAKDRVRPESGLD